jgi:hypothetical protein
MEGHRVNPSFMRLDCCDVVWLDHIPDSDTAVTGANRQPGSIGTKISAQHETKRLRERRLSQVGPRKIDV